MKTFNEIAQDSTKSINERQMAGLLARGYSKDEAIKQHQSDCNTDENESIYYYEAVLESIEQ